MAVIRLLRTTGSDIAAAGNVLVSNVMDLTGETAANVSFTVPGNATRAAQFHTVSGLPNNADWQDGTGSFPVVYVKVVTGFANVQWAVNIVREDNSGGNVEQQTLSAEQLGVSGNTLTFNDFLNTTWAAGSLSDRMRLRVQCRTTNATSRTPVFEVGTTSSSRLEILVTDDVQMLAAGVGGGTGAAASTSRAEMLATARASAADAAASSSRANMAASIRAGAAFAAAMNATAALAGSLRAGAASSAVANLTAALLARGWAAARSSGAMTGSAALTAAGRASAAAAAASTSKAALSAAARAVAAGAGQARLLLPMSAAGRSGARTRAIIAGTAGLIGRGNAAAAGAGAMRGTAALTAHGFAGAGGNVTLSLIVTGAAGCFTRIVQAVRDRYVAQIEVLEGVPTLHDNEPPEDFDDADIWVRFSIDVNPTAQLVLGAVPGHRYLGEATARIFLRAGLGDGDAWALADAIQTAFRGLTADEIVYTPPPYPTVRGLTGDRWEVEVTVPFYSACEEVALV